MQIALCRTPWGNLTEKQSKIVLPLDGWRRLCHYDTIGKLEIQILIVA